MENKNYGNLALSNNGFLFDTVTGNTYTLNKTGKVILEELINGTESENIISKIIDRFDITENIAKMDVQQFMHNLKEMKLI